MGESHSTPPGEAGTSRGDGGHDPHRVSVGRPRRRCTVPSMRVRSRPPHAAVRGHGDPTNRTSSTQGRGHVGPRGRIWTGKISVCFPSLVRCRRDRRQLNQGDHFESGAARDRLERRNTLGGLKVLVQQILESSQPRGTHSGAFVGLLPLGASRESKRRGTCWLRSWLPAVQRRWEGGSDGGRERQVRPRPRQRNRGGCG
jgi:hypothetical protein